MTASVLTVTVNPALDVSTATSRLIPQQKLRCEPPDYSPGGGGINVSRVIKQLGGSSDAFVALGGGTGEHYRRLLSEAGIPAEIWRMDDETRSSMSVLERSTGLLYRFVLPGPRVPDGEGDRMLARLSQILAEGYRYVVASGSLPVGVAAEFYGRLADLARGHGSSLILDTHGEALSAALPFRPYLIRLAHYEAQELLGGEPQRAAHAVAAELISRAAAEVVIVTVGEAGAIVRTAEHEFEIRPPKVVVNSAVGAGDSFVAALTHGLSRGWSLEDASRYGVAAAAAAVTTAAGELCSRELVDRCYADMGGQLAPVA